jgi:hypothetical protein
MFLVMERQVSMFVISHPWITLHGELALERLLTCRKTNNEWINSVNRISTKLSQQQTVMYSLSRQNRQTLSHISGLKF